LFGSIGLMAAHSCTGEGISRFRGALPPRYISLERTQTARQTTPASLS
jgi:hypothetical protein